MQKHRGDQCMKCGDGTFQNITYCSGRIFLGGGDLRIPCGMGLMEEHLHLSCSTCGYTVSEQTAEQRELRGENHAER